MQLINQEANIFGSHGELENALLNLHNMKEGGITTKYRGKDRANREII